MIFERARRRPFVLLAAASGAVILLLAAYGVVLTHVTPAPPHPPAAAPTSVLPATATTPAGGVRAADPSVISSPPPGELLSWAVVDVATGHTLTTGPNAAATSTVESTIKIWIGADYLAQHPQPTPGRLDEVSRMIRDSDDQAAQDLYQVDGGDLVIARLGATCHLDAYLVHDWWSRTTMTAPDMARMGACIAAGAPAGPRWTPWILDQMTNVRGPITDQHPTHGGGRWGIIDAIPPGHTVAIKNGWTLRPDGWHVNCLAVVDEQWALAVMLRYPAARGLPYGAGQCAMVAHALTGGPYPTGPHD